VYRECVDWNWTDLLQSHTLVLRRRIVGISLQSTLLGAHGEVEFAENLAP
jgi:hypothetical protein